MGASQCKPPCAPADPTQDTVKVNPTLLRNDPYSDKTQGDVIGQSFKASRDLEAGSRDRAAEQAKAEEEARAEEKRLRLEWELQEKIQRERAEAERQRQEKERVDREMAERKQQAEQLKRRDQERRAEEERLAREQREAEEKVQIFLKANGFKGVNEKRKKAFSSSSYALHCAVAQNSVEIVQSLLRCGADPKLKNSAGQTPQQLAEKCNKKGTHDRVLQELRNSQ